MKSLILFISISFFNHANCQEFFYKIRHEGKNLEVELSYTKKRHTRIYVPSSAKIQVQENEKEKHFVRYSVKGIKNWNFEDKDVRWIEKDFFHVDGRNLFFMPIISANTPIEVHIEWDGEEDFANSYGHLEKKQSFKTTCLNLQRAIFLGGKDFYFDKISIMGSDVFVLFNPILSNRKEILEKIQAIIQQQRTFYDANDFPNYLISILKDRKSGGATAFFNGCSLYLAKGIGAQEQIDWYFPHEHFHNFHGIRVNTYGTFQDFSWFIEGFTEYYTNLTNLRVGIYDEKGFVKKINQTIREYYQISKQRKYKRRIPYVKGHLLALHLDNLIQKESGNKFDLDDFMKDVYQTFYKENKRLSKQNLNDLFYYYHNETLFSTLVDEFLQAKNPILDEETWFKHNGLVGKVSQYKI